MRAAHHSPWRRRAPPTSAAPYTHVVGGADRRRVEAPVGDRVRDDVGGQADVALVAGSPRACRRRRSPQRGVARRSVASSAAPAVSDVSSAAGSAGAGPSIAAIWPVAATRVGPHHLDGGRGAPRGSTAPSVVGRRRGDDEQGARRGPGRAAASAAATRPPADQPATTASVDRRGGRARRRRRRRAAGCVGTTPAGSGSERAVAGPVDA